MPPIVVSCFDKTGNMVKPWVEAGYLCYIVDIQHPEGESRDGNLVRVGADIHTWQPPARDVVFASFFPPCTDVAVSGARWFKDKGLGALINALELFKVSVDLADRFGAPYLIENPVSTVSTYWRKPDYSFDPHEYGGYLNPLGDAYTKKTCLWTGNGFVMPDKKVVEPTEGSRMHLIPPGPERANLRSATPLGFAYAVFEANAPHLARVA
jgi:hypothetical protein